MTETPTVAERFKKKVSITRSFLQGRNYHAALRALELGMKWHTGVRKDNETPEFMHQVEITQYMITLEPHLVLPEQTLAACLLHDLTEDYEEFDARELRQEFPAETAAAVETLSKLRGRKESRFKLDDAVYYREIQSSPIASLVKGADRINNVGSMHGVFTREKQFAYIRETEELVLPMLKAARRLHTEQHAAYENIKFVLNTQIRLIRAALDAGARAA